MHSTPLDFIPSYIFLHVVLNILLNVSTLAVTYDASLIPVLVTLKETKVESPFASIWRLQKI